MLFSDAQWANEELTAFSDGIGKFLDREVLPRRKEFETAGAVPREIWQKAGDNGLLGISVPEELGGLSGSLTHESILLGELGLRNEMGFGYYVHSIAVHYVLAYGTEYQKEKWLPKLATGDLIGAICMSEPGAGSDLQGIKTTATADGNEYVINGSKTFISNGQIANFLVVVAKTDKTQGAKGISLLGVETDGLEGFSRGQNLEKLGLKSQDTSELFFNNARVPSTALIGPEEGQGFIQMMQQLPWERLIIAILGVGIAEAALQEAVSYTQERKAFGKSIAEFQNTRFKLAEAKTKIEFAKAYVEKCIGKITSDTGLSAAEASMAKYLVSEIQNEVVDECLQLHGGYGFMMEYPIARMFADSRVQKIYGGTNEIMKELIARSLLH
ncbi:MAG: acyl-CoA dehydrogenase family protein [Pseudomonadota bacterium]